MISGTKGNGRSADVNQTDAWPLLPVHAKAGVYTPLEKAMLKPALILVVLFAVSGLAEAGTPRNVHLDRKGDRIKQNR